MELQLSDVCPECGSLGTMIEIDGDYRLVSPQTWETEAEYETISLKEECTECEFTQTLGCEYIPDPDSLPGGHDDY